jgi:hypothetical protein
MSGRNQTRDANMCVVARRLLHDANQRNHPAMQAQVSGAGPEQHVMSTVLYLASKSRHSALVLRGAAVSRLIGRLDSCIGRSLHQLIPSSVRACQAIVSMLSSDCHRLTPLMNCAMLCGHTKYCNGQITQALSLNADVDVIAQSPSNDESWYLWLPNITFADGQQHTVGAMVFNANPFFPANTELLVFTDCGSRQVTDGVLSNDLTPAPMPAVSAHIATTAKGPNCSIRVDSNRNFIIISYVNKSQGCVETTVRESVNFKMAFP